MYERCGEVLAVLRQKSVNLWYTYAAMSGERLQCFMDQGEMKCNYTKDYYKSIASLKSI